MAARSYFGKPAKALSAVEGALLAGLAKGPNYFNPDRHPERARERLAYVLGRMQDDAKIDAAAAQAVLPQLVEYRPTRRDFGFHFVDHIAREAKVVADLDTLTNPPTRCTRPSIRPCSASSKRHCRRASRGTS